MPDHLDTTPHGPATDYATGTPLGALPLVVDLDHTFLRVDVLYETIWRVATSPAAWWRLLRAAPTSRAALKSALVREAPDVTLLPVHEPLRAWLAAERAAGRPVVLATATHEVLARRVAAHWPVFDDVMATTEAVNLKGPRKRDALVARFGRGGFVYVGDSMADRAVWEASAGAVVVRSARRDVTRGLNVPVLREFDGPSLGDTLETLLRPSRWWWIVGPLLAMGLRFREEWRQARLNEVPLGALSRTAVGLWVLLMAVAVGVAIGLLRDLRLAARDRARGTPTPVAQGGLSAPAAFALALLLLTVAGGLALHTERVLGYLLLLATGAVMLWLPREQPARIAIELPLVLVVATFGVFFGFLGL